MEQRLSWEAWTTAISEAVLSVRDMDLHATAEAIMRSDLVVTAGNGGSSSLASHMAQTIAKPTYAAGGGRRAVCLTDHTPTLTAHANDGGWDGALVESARPFFRTGTLFIAFSSSGRSENVCRVARLARDCDCGVVAFTGFTGDPLRRSATISLHVASNDYEVVEPVHDALMHRVQHHLRYLRQQ